MDIFNPTTGEILKIPSPDLSGYVPYTGATSDVGLGSYKLTAKSLVIDYIPITSGTSGGANEGLLSMGIEAGTGATGAANSAFIGGYAGYGATNAYEGVFMGVAAGMDSTDAYGSIFLGQYVGGSASNAHNSVFIGSNSGTGATNAFFSAFIGDTTGNSAINAAYSVFIGGYTGYEDTVNNASYFGNRSSISIGYWCGTGGFYNSFSAGIGVKNSNIGQINIGNVFYVDDMYTTFSNPTGLPKSGKTTISSSVTNIGDVSSLGAEKLTNGTFTGSASSWTLGTGWTYSTNTVRKSADGTGTLSQAVGSMATQFVVGEMYYITFTTSSHTVGSFVPSVGGVTLPTIEYENRNQTFGYIFTALSNTALTFTPSNTSRFYLDNISIKKITGGNLNVAGTANMGGASIMDAGNIAVGSTTGTKFGTATTQKLAFWNATPIVQPANTTAIDTLLVNTGLRASGAYANFATTVQLRQGTTAANTAPIKFTTQSAGLTNVEQGAMELIGNSLQFTQFAKRRGVQMSQSVRTSTTTVENTVTESGALITAEHGANYLEVGKCEILTIVGTLEQRANPAAKIDFKIKYAGTTIHTISTTANNVIAAGSPFKLTVWTTVRTTGTTGTMQINSALEVNAEPRIGSATLATINTTTAQDTTITATWGEANAANIFKAEQAFVQCIETNK